MEIYRTPDERFTDLPFWDFTPNYCEVNSLRMHYIDEGSPDAPVMLLLHGEPSWSYLYRHWITVLVDAGYRVIALDAVGFGRSDKVTDPDWYSLDRHVDQLVGFIEALNLRTITIAVQDWAGPVGLIVATEHSDRFVRLLVMNTWLHHHGFEYSDAIRAWHEMAKAPDLAFGSIVGGESSRCSCDSAEVLSVGFEAPFTDRASMAGAVAWPAMLPYVDPDRAGAERQERALSALASWDRPAHFLFGDRDRIFTVEWGERFAAMVPRATFGAVLGGTHFVQEVGRPLAERFLDLIAAE